MDAVKEDFRCMDVNKLRRKALDRPECVKAAVASSVHQFAQPSLTHIHDRAIRVGDG